MLLKSQAQSQVEAQSQVKQSADRQTTDQSETLE